MKVEFEKIYHDNQVFDCYSGLIATICEYKNIEWSSIFANNWDFSYKKSCLSDDMIIGGNIFKDDVLVEIKNDFKVTYHSKKVKSVKALLEFVNIHLENNDPIIIGYDTFSCPWLDDYHIMHSLHFSMIYNVENNDFICLDILPFKTKMHFKKDNLFQCIKEIITIDKVDTNSKTSVKQILQSLIKRVYNEQNPYFENIQNFSDTIRDKFIISNENDKNHNEEFIGQIPFLKDIIYIVRLKKSFALCVEIYSKKDNTPGIELLIEKLYTVASEWYQIWAVTQKYFLYSRTDKNYGKFLNIKIDKVIELEKDCILNIQSFLNNNTVVNTFKNQNYITRNVNKTTIVTQYYQAILNQYYNNKAFGENNIEDKADFTSTGAFYTRPHKIQCFQYKSINMELDKIHGFENDNISCCGQKIIINNKKSKSILLVGCEENFDEHGVFIVEYVDGSEEEVLVEFSDWATSAPQYGENIAFQFSGFYKKTNSIINETLNIYAKEYFLNNTEKGIKAILFPLNLSLHIFKMYLGE